MNISKQIFRPLLTTFKNELRNTENLLKISFNQNLKIRSVYFRISVMVADQAFKRISNPYKYFEKKVVQKQESNLPIHTAITKHCNIGYP